MDINATIFVQAFNFFIAYWMLRLFLFKPVVTIIEHEKAQHIAMLDIIDQQKKSLDIQEKERKRHWYICQEYFNTNQPHIPPKKYSDETEFEAEIISPVSDDTIAATIIHARNALEEKLKHVH